MKSPSHANSDQTTSLFISALAAKCQLMMIMASYPMESLAFLPPFLDQIALDLKEMERDCDSYRISNNRGKREIYRIYPNHFFLSSQVREN